MVKKVNTKRKSESTAKSITAAQYNEALQEYYSNNTELVRLGTEMDDHIQEIMDQYTDDIDLLKGKQALLFAVIKGYCLANKESLLSDGKKSFENLYAKIGFRTATPSLKLLKGVKWEDVLENLKTVLPAYIRTEEVPDKERLIADRDKEEVAGKFEELGVKVSQEEKFFVDLKKVEVAA